MGKQSRKGFIVENRDTVQDSWPARHEKFQDKRPLFEGHNPCLMSDFEKSLVEKEKIERHMVKVRQVLGQQGVDGGRFPRAQT